LVRALAHTPGKLDDMKEQIDEIRIGEVTKPETLKGFCNGIDVVFSSIGITKQRDRLTFKDVDYQGNKNLLDVAKQAGVRKFVYVSVLDGPDLCHLEIVRAHEDFVQELKSSGLDYAVLRPTGYFSDMGEVYEMARKGRVYLIGPGNNRVNPIHGADLAVSCVDAIEGTAQEVNLGGPEAMTWREIAELAFASQNKPARITSVPAWVMSFVIFLTRLFSRHSAELLAFFTAMATRDVVGPATGSHTLSAHYQNLGAPK
jgi:uncharacterized protein YbjT (DUF2867 family)